MTMQNGLMMTHATQKLPSLGTAMAHPSPIQLTTPTALRLGIMRHPSLAMPSSGTVCRPTLANTTQARRDLVQL